MTEQPKETPVALRFEEALEQLQVAVKRLEGGDLSLEDSLRCFEDGVRLTRICQDQLHVAEQRVEILMKSATGGEAELQPFTGTRG